MIIRPADHSDLPGLLAIYNDVIATSTAVYTNDPVTLEDRQAWFEARVALFYPVLVATDETGITGFSTFGDFRAWPCYCHTVEHSVHVRADRRGLGLGAKLVEALFPIATGLNKHVMVAGVDAANAGSLAFHERLGFEQVGHFKEVGYKFGGWLDLVFLQRYLTPAGSRPDDIRTNER